MTINFSPDAQAVHDQLRDDKSSRAYERLWEVLKRIDVDPEEAKHAGWANYVSTFNLWGSKVPGTDYSVYWRTDPGGVIVVHLLQDNGY